MLPYKRNFLHFEFAANSLFAGDQNQYQTRLVGFDEDWSDFSPRISRDYTNLREGHYVFEVRARNRNERLTESTRYTFTILPPWYRTSWAYLIYLVGLIALVYGAAHYRSGSLRRYHEELRANVAARTAELDRKNRELAEKIEQLRVSEHHAQEEKAKALQSEHQTLEARETAVQARRGSSAREQCQKCLPGQHEPRAANTTQCDSWLRSTSGAESRLQCQGPGEPVDHSTQWRPLLGLINDVLSISKIEAGRVTLQKQPFDLTRMLSDLEDMFRTRAQTKGIQLGFEIAPGLPTGVVGDEGKLRQILINLLGNAVKFTEQGRVNLRAGWLDRRSVFEVEDTGPGIAEADREAIFEAFQQTDFGMRVGQGTGLGLTISRTFARLMGGDIRVRNRTPHGAQFIFDLQLPTAPLSKVEPEARNVVSLAPGQPLFRILVVDDQSENRTLLVRSLAPLGFDVREASDGEEALNLEQLEATPALDGHPHAQSRRLRGYPNHPPGRSTEQRR